MSGELNLFSRKDCYWYVIFLKVESIVMLKFIIFDFLKSDFLCMKDYVEIRNGFIKYVFLIGRYCGDKIFVFV